MKQLFLTTLLTILQIEPAEMLTPHLGDQLFSVALLVAFAVFMINRAKQSREYYDNELKTAKAEYKAEIKILADKMDKYMEQDRKDMQRVIEANTRVMERLEDFLDRNNR